MILGVSGLGNTGSMAVIDFLREYDEIFFDKYMGESSLCYLPDGVMDLEYHLVERPFRFQSSDVALDRFEKLITWIYAPHRGEEYKYRKRLYDVSREYIKSITQIEWEGTWSYWINNAPAGKKFIQKVLFKLKKYLGKTGTNLYDRLVSHKMRYSVRLDSFAELTKKYLRDLIQVTNPEPDKIIMVDMLFPGDNPESCFHYFDDPYAIIVDRDPRDLYILSKIYVRCDSLWIPTDNVKDYITYYRTMRTKADMINDTGRVLRMNYEDLIYDMPKVKEELERFLKIQHHVNPGKYFHVSDSINNTQLYQQFPEYEDDIKEITSELSEWIYDFDKYGKIEHTKKAW